MQFLKSKWFWIPAALLFVGVSAALFFSGPNLRERRVADGTVVRIEKVAFGKRERIIPQSWLDQIKSKIPPGLLGHFAPPIVAGSRGSWWQNTRAHTNDDALYIYVTRRNTLLGGFTNVDANNAQLVDEHGCVFLSTQAGGEDWGLSPMTRTLTGFAGPQSTINWFRFEAFPRREKEFNLRLFDRQMKILAEFTIRNPTRLPAPTNWLAAPFPISVTNGDTVFALAKLTVKSNPPPRVSAGMSPAWSPNFGQPLFMSPKYEITESGAVSSNWQALDTELYDSAGDFCGGNPFQQPILCLQEPAWKLRVRFFGSESAHDASNEVWTLRGITVPTNGQFAMLYRSNTMVNESKELQGVSLTAIAIGGPGNFVYQNDVPSEGAAPTDLTEENNVTESWRNGSQIPDYRLHGKSPHLALKVGDMTDDQRLTIRVTDDQGRQIYGVEWQPFRRMDLHTKKPSEIHFMAQEFGSPSPFYLLDLPADAKTLDISICIHRCFTAEYIFKPPPPEAPSDKSDADKPTAKFLGPTSSARVVSQGEIRRP